MKKEISCSMAKKMHRDTEQCIAKPANDCVIIQQTVSHYKNRDPQTGLPNLDLLTEKVEIQLKSGNICHLLFSIINGIEEIGEYHGFEAALYVLQTTSRRLQAAFEKTGIVARIHGNLFASICSTPDIDIFVRQLHNNLAHPITWNNETFQLAVHIGVVKHGDAHKSAQSLIQSGYAAAKECQKHNHRGGFHFFSRELWQNMEKEYQIGIRLRSAIADGNFSLAMQPLIDAHTGLLHGAETLIRWQDLHLGSIPPSEFIPIAERNGTITDITDWVLDRALIESSHWLQSDHGAHIAINISAIDLYRPDLTIAIEKLLKKHNIKPRNVVIELTESAITQDPAQSLRQLLALKGTGIILALDDFGTGYSSLGQLKNFPIDIIKIDRTFISDLPSDEGAKSIIFTIVSLARALNVKTVAEGVETYDQLQFLRNAGVDSLQGYIISPPLNSHNFFSSIQKDSTPPWRHLF